MYEFIISDTMVVECIYCDCTLYSWSVQRYIAIDGKWHRYGKVKRYETLEEAREYCISLIRKEKKHARMD